MFIHDLLDKVSKKKRAKTARRFYTGMGILVAVVTGVILIIRSRKETKINMKNKAENMADAIKDGIKKKADTMRTGATHTTEEVRRVIKDVDGKIKSVKEDIKDGSHDVKKDIHETIKNISKEIKGK